ncbi:hypothetical protein, partial [Brunnivagina elsteri]
MNDILKFNDMWDCELYEGMRLEVLDTSDYDVYDCEVTRLENAKKFALKNDTISLEMAINEVNL